MTVGADSEIDEGADGGEDIGAGIGSGADADESGFSAQPVRANPASDRQRVP